MHMLFFMHKFTSASMFRNVWFTSSLVNHTVSVFICRIVSMKLYNAIKIIFSMDSVKQDLFNYLIQFVELLEIRNKVFVQSLVASNCQVYTIKCPFHILS